MLNKVETLTIRNKRIEWLRDSWAGYSSLIGSVLLAIAGVWSQIESGNLSVMFLSLLSLGILMTLAGGIKQTLSAPGVRKLKDELQSKTQELNQSYEVLGKTNETYKKKSQNIINNELFILSNILNFTNTERISLYLYKEDNQMFKIGRYSQNEFYNSNGRTVPYMNNQGVLEKSWNEGECFVDNLPEERGSYLDNCVNTWSIDESIALGLRMRSRTIGAFRIQDSYNYESIAVLVFESTKAYAFSREDLKKLMNDNDGRESKRVALLIRELGESIPNSNIASKEGY